MTHFLGPAVTDDGGNPSTRFLRRANITHELIRKLPSAAIYQYKCHRDITDAIAFQQEQFHTSVQFTYEVIPAPEDLMWKNMRSEKRKKIRSAQRSVIVADRQDPMEFWRFYDDNLRKKGSKNVCSQQTCCQIIEGCLSRGQGRILASFERGRMTAAIFCLWDNTSSYYFMSSRTTDAHYGAVSLLAWEAMKDAAARGLIFDFDGLNSSKAVLFFTEFGGVVSPRFIVTRQNLLGGIALGIKNMSRASRFFY
jgi:lipid II:glycine glycyltransferase (peptidoglycan interpeptide bridge formation enzyme)